MRRVIAAVSNFADVGDVTTLANPEIVDEIRHHVQSEKPRTAKPARAPEKRERRSQRTATPNRRPSARPPTAVAAGGALFPQQTGVVDELAECGGAPRIAAEAADVSLLKALQQIRSVRPMASCASRGSIDNGQHSTSLRSFRTAASHSPGGGCRSRVAPRTARQCTAGSPKIPKSRYAISVPRKAEAGNGEAPQHARWDTPAGRPCCARRSA